VIACFLFLFFGGRVPKYDLAVIGAGLGGLAAAALACKMNKKTIVLESGDAVGGALQAYRRNGFSFYPAPSLSFGFERGGALQQLNEKLGIAQNASLRSPCYQVALPDRRITIYAEHSETLEELRREFPGEIDKIVLFYQDIRKQALQNAKSTVSAFLSCRRSVSGFIRSYRFSREFAAFLDAQAYYFFLRPASTLRQTSLITLFDAAPFTLETGFLGLAERIFDVLVRSGCEIRYQVPYEQMTLQPHTINLPQESIQAETVLLNTEHAGEHSFLVSGIKAEVVPVGMLQDVLCVPDYAHPECLFTLSISAAEDKNAAPSGMRALTVCFFNGMGASIKARGEQLAEMVPFLEDFTVFEEEYRPVPRETGLNHKKLSFKSLRTADNDLLQRTSMGGIFMLADGIGTPLQSLAAVQQFMRYMK
jgi:hypothetical protein